MYESTQAMDSHTVVEIGIFVFQVLLTIVGALVHSAINEVRSRIVRLENIVMGNQPSDGEWIGRRRRG